MLPPTVSIYDGRCRWMEVIEERDRSAILTKREKVKFYTFELYDRLFISKDTVCYRPGQHITTLVVDGHEPRGPIGELRKLIFRPGSPSKIPFIGQKTEIFTEKMQPYYDFFIRSEQYLDRYEAYVFEARLKSAYRDGHFNKTVIKELTTYFSKKDFQVLGRSYRLAHRKLLYRFDVRMDIQLTRVDGYYFPAHIHYTGDWNMPTKETRDRIV